MAIELALMGAAIAAVLRRWPRGNEWLILTPVLLLGRLASATLAYGFSLLNHLPAGYVAAASLLSGWPGIILMLVVVPPIARMGRRTARRSGPYAIESGD
jgi:hypothetical protein